MVLTGGRIVIRAVGDAYKVAAASEYLFVHFNEIKYRFELFLFGAIQEGNLWSSAFIFGSKEPAGNPYHCRD